MIWLTADTHLRHANILKYLLRPWLTEQERETILDIKRRNGDDWRSREMLGFRVSLATREAHDNDIIDNINACVEPGDTLYHLGDFAFRDWKVLRSRIRCRKFIFVQGNHDPWIYDKTRAPYWFRRLFYDHYYLVQVTHQYQGRNVLMMLAHYPCVTWFGSHHGSVHFHGHNHGTLWPRIPRSYDVGVDSVAELIRKKSSARLRNKYDYRPIALDEVMEIVLADEFVPVSNTESLEVPDWGKSRAAQGGQNESVPSV